MKVFHKLFQTKATSIDEDTKSVTFVISTNQKDRYGDIVDQKSWNFKDYTKNPIVLWGHNPDEPENVLGTAKDLQVAGDGSQTTATLTFDTDINPKADLVFNQVLRGTLRTVSVGFRNHTLEWDNDDPVLKDNELFEISVVPIPANAGALAKDLKAGELNVKDARWLMDGMRKEADLLDEQLKQLTNKEKSMTEEQATAVLDSLAKVTEQLGELKTAVEEQNAVIAELKADDNAEAADEEQQEQEEEQSTEAQEEQEQEAENQPDPAKGGEQTSPEPEAEEFDPEAELTPELQAEIDAALEEIELEPAA